MTDAKSMSSPTSFRAAARMRTMGMSRIVQISEHAHELKRQGRDVISLGMGEPDFDTPDHIKAAANRAIAAGQTKYTPTDGIAELKSAVRAKFSRENNLDYSLDEISVAAGSKQVIYNAFMATLDEGDEVILPAPYFTVYASMARILGARPVIVACAETNGFRLDPEALESAITPRTRWLVLNSPCNPSGSAYTAGDYLTLLKVLKRHPHVWLLADDIYEHILYDDFPFSTPAALDDEIKTRTLTVNGVSKSYAMTGWRIGFGAGPSPLIRQMAVVQNQSTSNPCSVSQAAAVEALNGPQHFIAERRLAFQTRRDLVVEALNNTPGLACRKPEGAFYAFPSCAGLLGKRTPAGGLLATDDDFCTYLLDQVGVAAVPGSCFGLAKYFRLSYATSMEALRAACARIAKACCELSD